MFEKTDNTLAGKLAAWSLYNAAFLIMAMGLSALSGLLFVIPATGLLSFSFLLISVRGEWTEKGVFGAANIVTASRLLGILIFFIIYILHPARYTVLLALILLLCDGLDGWVARRFNLVSRFGSHFDMETDAFFAFTITFVLYKTGLLGPWILLGGGLRYLMVLARYFSNKKLMRERRTVLGRYSYVVSMLLLLISFILPLHLRAISGLTATAILLYSFTGDFKSIITDSVNS